VPPKLIDGGWCAVALCAPVARQSIPRFDLYAALGVEPSADAIAIEAAYDDLIQEHGAGTGAAVERRIFRARVAREWLTDPDLRDRYDASRDRAASRAAAKAAGTVAESDAGDDAADDLPWLTADDLPELDRPPAADVDRPDPTIAWSTTPPAPPEPRARRSSRRPVSAIGLGALIVVAAITLYIVFQAFGSNDTASRATPTPPPVQTAAPTPTTAPPTLPPTVEPTVEPTGPPPTQGANIAAFQQAAWDTLQKLITAADAGDVTTAQTYLDDSAPGLRASGLRRAVFPEMTAQQVVVTPSVGGYTAALTDGTTASSADGTTWTFDYGDRPLAAYKSPGTPTAHDLWWMPKSVKHHIFLRVTIATVSKTGVLVTAKWSFDPSLPNDATYFAAADFRVSALTFDGVDIPVTGDINAMAGVTTRVARALFVGTAPLPDEMAVTLSVTPDGNPDRSVETTFVLEVR
jgi:hypothetical protein